MIYLDNAATTRMYTEVILAVAEIESNFYGNPGSKHKMGELARRKLKAARENVAALIDAEPEEIVFTSGGSEANNLIFQGIISELKRRGKTTILTSSAEHHSIKRVAGYLEKNGISIVKCPIKSNGCCDLEALRNLINVNNVGLVSIMYVNNELGSVNDITYISKLCHKSGILFHADCVQALGATKVSMKNTECDFASFASHKIHGPKGVGAVYIKDKSLIEPLIYGGNSQEFGLRGGTENVPGIVGFGEACRIVNQNLLNNLDYIRKIKQTFVQNLIQELDRYGILEIFHNNEAADSTYVDKILNIRFDGVDAETLTIMAGSGDNPVCISSGSACEEHESKPSEVLIASGLSAQQARESVRISFSELTTIEEVESGAKSLASTIKWLKGV